MTALKRDETETQCMVIINKTVLEWAQRVGIIIKLVINKNIYYKIHNQNILFLQVCTMPTYDGFVLIDEYIVQKSKQEKAYVPDILNRPVRCISHSNTEASISVKTTIRLGKILKAMEVYETELESAVAKLIEWKQQNKSEKYPSGEILEIHHKRPKYDNRCEALELMPESLHEKEDRHSHRNSRLIKDNSDMERFINSL